MASIETDATLMNKPQLLPILQHTCLEITTTEKFKENPEQILDDDEYERPGSDQGLLVIFNQQSFENKPDSTRMGTNRDVNELILTFGRLGYNIDHRHIHNNLTRAEILDVINELSETDYSDRNSLIVVVLTHGEANNVLQAYDGQFSTNEIWEPFSNTVCESFRNKPKFFIIQACKGEEFSQVEKTSGDIIPPATFQTPLEADILIAFATVEGSISHRHTTNGSWFIQELCRNFNTYARRDDVITLLLRVTKCVASNYYWTTADEDNKKEVTTKQMSLLISTLTKKFYLCKNKDRNLLLTVQKQQESILDCIKGVLQSRQISS